MLGIGELKLDPMYVNLAVPETVFYRKSQAQKQAVLKKFYSEGVKAPQEVLPNEDDDEDDKKIHYGSLREKAELFVFRLQS